MYLIYIFNLFIYTFLECFYPIYLCKKLNLNLISPIGIFAFSFLPINLFKVFIGPFFILEEGLMDKYFNFAILMSNIALVAKFILTKYSLLFFKKNKFISRLAKTCMPHWKAKRNKTIIAAFILFIFALCCFVLLASHSYGLSNWIMNPRFGYQYHRTGAGHFYAFAILFYSTSFTLFCIYLKKNINVIKILLLFLICIYFLGSKEVLLQFMLSGLTFLWFRKYKKLKKAIFIGIPCVFIFMLLNFGSITFSEIAQYFDYYVNSAMYYEEYFNGGIDLYYGEIYFSSFWEIIPRSIFPDKPHVYGFLLVNEHFFPGMAEATHIPAFGGPISAFADWGILGVLISSFLDFSFIFNIFLYSYLFKNVNLEDIRRNPALVYCILLLFAPAFMRFIGFPLNIFIWIFIVKIISWLNRIVFKSQIKNASIR